ncbi:hypothetical protein Pla52n_00580 [Stieleria varia]|uniref:Uncharacterized protein n=1 Tax=Stieleria varia TaxID=2528005 RepID=A0A5C6B5B9_9BACT|nr:hypothetical protein Pla52n_00580 [Stieleria varia]
METRLWPDQTLTSLLSVSFDWLATFNQRRAFHIVPIFDLTLIHP